MCSDCGGLIQDGICTECEQPQPDGNPATLVGVRMRASPWVEHGAQLRSDGVALIATPATAAYFGAPSHLPQHADQLWDKLKSGVRNSHGDPTWHIYLKTAGPDTFVIMPPSEILRQHQLACEADPDDTVGYDGAFMQQQQSQQQQQQEQQQPLGGAVAGVPTAAADTAPATAPAAAHRETAEEQHEAENGNDDGKCFLTDEGSVLALV